MLPETTSELPIAPLLVKLMCVSVFLLFIGFVKSQVKKNPHICEDFLKVFLDYAKINVFAVTDALAKLTPSTVPNACITSSK